jgi:hypothetical protein
VQIASEGFGVDASVMPNILKSTPQLRQRLSSDINLMPLLTSSGEGCGTIGFGGYLAGCGRTEGMNGIGY